MRNYSNLSVEELFNLYVIHDEERSAIDSFALTLPELQKETFLSLKTRNAGALGLVPSPFDGKHTIKMLKTDVPSSSVKFIGYDPYDFESYKYMIDSLLCLDGEDSERKPYIVEIELAKCQQRLDDLKQEGLRLSTTSFINANVDKQQEVRKCMSYLVHLGDNITKREPYAKEHLQKHSAGVPIPKYIAPPDNTKLKLKAMKFLDHLSGYNLQGRLILEPNDYNRLLQYTDELIEHERVAEEVEPIYQVGVTQNHMRYTYYMIHSSLYSKRNKRRYFIDFLHTVFPVLFKNSDKETTYTKFSIPPPSYYRDVKSFLTQNGEEGKIGE